MLDRPAGYFRMMAILEITPTMLNKCDYLG